MDNWKEKEVPTTRRARSVDGSRLSYKHQTTVSSTIVGCFLVRPGFTCTAQQQTP